MGVLPFALEPPPFFSVSLPLRLRTEKDLCLFLAVLRLPRRSSGSHFLVRLNFLFYVYFALTSSFSLCSPSLPLPPCQDLLLRLHPNRAHRLLLVAPPPVGALHRTHRRTLLLRPDGRRRCYFPVCTRCGRQAASTKWIRTQVDQGGCGGVDGRGLGWVCRFTGCFTLVGQRFDVGRCNVRPSPPGLRILHNDGC